MLQPEKQKSAWEGGQAREVTTLLVRRKRILARALFCLLASVLMTVGACEKKSTNKKSGPVTITFFGWSPFTRAVIENNQKSLDRFTQETGIRVKLIPGSENATERLPVIQEMLKKESDAPDVYFVDVVWPALLADQLLDLTPYRADESRQFAPEALRNATVNGKLVAMPLENVAGALYYRTDLLKKYGYAHPPESWDELEKVAARIQAGERAGGNRNFWGFVWQGAPYEGLTCNALEWQVSQGGGRNIEPDGTISVNNLRTLKAMKMAKRWVGTISPPSVTSYKEQDSWVLWDSGNAAFLRYWAWEDLLPELFPDSPIKGKIAVTWLPSGGARHASTMGGHLLGVSKHSGHPREAALFVRFMASRRLEDRASFEGFGVPIHPELYADPEVLKANPEMAKLKYVFADAAVARPSTVAGKHYDEVSNAYFTAVHDILTGKTEAVKALAGLESQLAKITGFKTGRPVQETNSAAKSR